MLHKFLNSKNELQLNFIMCVILSPLLYLFIKYYTGSIYLLLLLPLPLVVTKLRYFLLGFILSACTTVLLTLLIPEPVQPYRIVSFGLWLERLLICFEFGIIQLSIYGLKRLTQTNINKVNNNN